MREALGKAGRLLLSGLAIAAATMALVTVLAWVFQRHLIYLPERASPPPAATVLPGSEEVSFRTQDGLRLAAWFLPGEDDGPAVLVLPGNAGNRAARAPLAEALAGSGLSVLLVDYRGYGGNPGTPSEAGLLADARAAVAYLAARPDVDPARIVYFGESLGAGVAVALAVERPAAAIVLRSPFTSLADVARVHYPFLPTGLLLRDRYAAIEQIGRVTTPILVVAGGEDRIVPVEQSRRLHDAAPEPKRLVVIPGADHNDYALLAGDRLVEEVLRFLREMAGIR